MRGFPSRRDDSAMNRRTFVAGVVVAPLAVRQPAGAQVSGKVYRLGFLGQGSKGSSLFDGGAFEMLISNLRALGYIEGTNLTVDARFAEGRTDVLDTLAAQLVAARPDVIAVANAGLAQAMLEHTKTLPVVALSPGSLEQSPGGNSL